MDILDRGFDNIFDPGETVYDVDGNAFLIVNNRATLKNGGYRISYELTPGIADCLSRDNPKQKA